MVVVASDRLRYANQLRRAPSWEILQRQAVEFCDRSFAALVAEVSQYERGSDGWQVVSGALDFCREVPPILEESRDRSMAWRSVMNVCGRVPLLSNAARRKRALGKSQIMNHVVLGLQTGRIMDLELPLGFPRCCG